MSMAQWILFVYALFHVSVLGSQKPLTQDQSGYNPQPLRANSFGVPYKNATFDYMSVITVSMRREYR